MYSQRKSNKSAVPVSIRIQYIHFVIPTAGGISIRAFLLQSCCVRGQDRKYRFCAARRITKRERGRKQFPYPLFLNTSVSMVMPFSRKMVWMPRDCAVAMCWGLSSMNKVCSGLRPFSDRTSSKISLLGFLSPTL